MVTNKSCSQESLHAARVRLFQILCALDSPWRKKLSQLEIEACLEELFVEPEAAAGNVREAESGESGAGGEDMPPRVPFVEYRRSCEIACSVCGVLPEIDALIETYSTEWKTDRMSLVDRTIIRLALYEAVIMKTVPVAVALSEAVLLGRDYGSSESPRFVNGVLARIIKGLSLS